MAIIDIPSTLEELAMYGNMSVQGKTIADALVYTIRNKCRIDIEYMSSICGLSKDEIIDFLTERGLIYQNPAGWDGDPYSNWELASEYLSGNIFTKLNQAKAAAEAETRSCPESAAAGSEIGHRTYGRGVIVRIENGIIMAQFKNCGFKRFTCPDAFNSGHITLVCDKASRFDRNIAALQNIMPEMVKADEIHVQLGSPWLDSNLIDKFIWHLLGPVGSLRYREHLKTVHETVTGSWHIPHKSRYGPNDYKLTAKYGTESMNALTILEKLLNNADIVVYDYDSKKKPIKNPGKTAQAREKAKLIKAEFDKFVHENAEVRCAVEHAYYSKFASIVQRRFNGDIFDFPGLNPAITLHKYQKDGFAHCVLADNTLLAYDVGAGKTYIMIAAAMEMRRMGISERNLFVVPNNILGQWEDFFRELYPACNIFVVGPKNFTPKLRGATMAKVRDGDFDAVIIAYSCFDMISLSTGTSIEQLQEELFEVREAIRAAGSRKIPSLRNRERSLSKEIDKLIKQKDDTANVYFDELGVNTLFIDEIHNYKNISIGSHSFGGTYGVSKNGSAKNNSMLEKIHYVQRQNGGRGIIAATGTPITNSITDLYALQLMLQSGELALSGINSFDEWIGTFAKREESFEVDIDVNGFRNAVRYSFHNIPELAALFSSVADFHIIKQDNLPPFDGYTEIVLPKTGGMIAFNNKLSHRVDEIRAGLVPKEQDNLLKVTVESMLACLDLRLVSKDACFDKNLKVFRCAEQVAEMYFKYDAEKFAQLVFCDFSTPKPGFNVYDELKRILTVYFGIPAGEIAFVHDATTDRARSKLFADTRGGRVRILVGSTKKLGTGVNVQDRLVAIHHLDVPWSPADMVQREGRILRSGNTCPKVYIFRYTTQGSFDAYSYQLLEKKQKFISQILDGCIADRDGKDVDMLLTYAEIKSICIGREELKKRFEAEVSLSRYRQLKKQAAETAAAYRDKIAKLEKDIPEWNRIAMNLESDARHAENESFKDEKALRDSLNETILREFRPGDYGEEAVIVRNYHGFQLVRPRVVSATDPVLIVRRDGSYDVSLIPSKEGTLDPAARINALIRALPLRSENAAETLETLITRKEQYKLEIETMPDYSDEIERCVRLIEYYDAILTGDRKRIS